MQRLSAKIFIHIEYMFKIDKYTENTSKNRSLTSEIFILCLGVNFLYKPFLSPNCIKMVKDGIFQLPLPPRISDLGTNFGCEMPKISYS